MISALGQAVFGLLAAPLLVAGLSKLFVPAAELSWPYGSRLLAAPHGPRLVGAGEIGAAALILALPGGFAALVGLVSYTALAVVAYQLRGQKCACFGAARLASVGSAHIGANLVGAVVSAAALPFLAEPSPLPRLAGCVAGSAVLVVVLRQWDRRAAEGDGAPPCQEPVFGVRLYVSGSCPACRSLHTLIDRMEPARRDSITTVVLNPGDERPAGFEGLGVPSATGLDAAGEPVCSAVAGIGDVKALIDRIVVRLPGGTHAG